MSHKHQVFYKIASFLGIVAILTTLPGCITDNASDFVDRGSPTISHATPADYAGIWISTSYTDAPLLVEANGFITLYKLEPNGTGSMVYMRIEGRKRHSCEYAVAWQQAEPGKISIRHTLVKGSFFERGWGGSFTGNARLTSHGLEETDTLGTYQCYHPNSPELTAMVTAMHRGLDERPAGGAFNTLVGQVASAALSSSVNTLVNNPNATASEVRYEAAKGALEAAQDGLEQ